MTVAKNLKGIERDRSIIRGVALQIIRQAARPILELRVYTPHGSVNWLGIVLLKFRETSRSR